MAELTAELTLELAKARKSLKEFGSMTDRAAKRASDTGKRMGPGLFGGLAKAAKMAMGAAMGAMRQIAIGALRQIGYTITTQFQQQIGTMFSNSGADEKLAVAFETLVGGADKARKVIGELKILGASTPFQFLEDIAPAGRSLIAFGEDAENVAEVLRRVGDVAAGVDAPLNEIAQIYGKARVQGTLFAEDINQLTGRGIPVIQEFAKQLGVTDGEVKKMASKGMVTFPMLEKAFIDLTSASGKFAGMMQKQSLTFVGLISTLKDNWTELLINFGRPIQTALKPMLSESIVLVNNLRERSVAIGEAIGKSLMKAVEAARVAFQIFTKTDILELASVSLKLAFKEAVNLLAAGMQSAFASSATFLLESLKIIGTMDFWKGLFNVFNSLWDANNAALMKGISTWMGALGKMKFNPLKDVHEAISIATGNVADTLSKKRDASIAASVDAFAGKEVRDVLRDALAAGASNFMEMMEGASRIYDTDEDRRKLLDALKKIGEATKKAGPGAVLSGQPKTAPGPGSTGGGESGTAPTAGSKSQKATTPLGAFFREVNALYGRSPQESIAAEAKRHTGLLETIAKNTTPQKAPRKPLAQQNPVAVFG